MQNLPFRTGDMFDGSAKIRPATLEDQHLSPQAQQSRDEIIDLLLEGHQEKAILRYVEASGKGFPEAKSIIERLNQVLQKPGLDAAEQAFLAGFRTTLNRRGPAEPELPSQDILMDAHTIHPLGAANGVAKRVDPPPNQSPNPRAATTSNRLWGLGGLLLALTGLFFVGKNFFLASGQGEWAPVPAVVVQSYTSKSSKGSGGQTSYNSHFKYRYQVDGIQYTANRYSFWSLAGDQKAGVDRFHPGDELTAYHHPKWHRYAVVEQRPPSFFTWMAGLLLLLIAAPSVWMLWTGKSNG
jgi:hypothetical protein